jgi:hypothetical protein
LGLAAAFLLAAAGSSSYGLEDGPLPGGGTYVCGGIGLDETRSLHAGQDLYNLRVATVAFSSGAYLADIRLSVARAGGGTVVFDKAMDGPWCFFDLPPGAYDITAAWTPGAVAAGQTLRSRVALVRGVHRQLALRFAVPGDVGPERERP